MSWTDEEIDQLFQEGAKAQSFKYDNAYFSEVEAALPVNGKGKDFLWMGTALLFIAVLTTGYFINESEGNAFTATNGQVASADLTSKMEKVVEATSSAQANTGIKSNHANSQDAANGSEIFNDQTESLASSINTNVNTSSRQSNGWNPKTSAGNLKTDPLTKDLAKQLALSQGLNDQNTVSGQDQGIKTNNSQKVDAQSNKQVATSQAHDLKKSAITANLSTNAANQLDQGLDRSLKPNALPPLSLLSELRPKAGLYVELNGGLSQSLITPSNYTSTSIGGGIGVETYLGDFNLTTGLNFIVADHKDLFLTSADIQYSFGSSGRIDTYDFRRLYSLELPISIGYNFGKHNLNVGVRPSMLLGSKMKHQYFENEVLLRSQESNGLLDNGLRRFGLKPTIGYSYRMNNWVVGGTVGVQMMESVDELYTEAVNNHLPVDGQIYLRRIIRLRK